MNIFAVFFIICSMVSSETFAAPKSNKKKDSTKQPLTVETSSREKFSAEAEKTSEFLNSVENNQLDKSFERKCASAIKKEETARNINEIVNNKNNGLLSTKNVVKENVGGTSESKWNYSNNKLSENDKNKFPEKLSKTTGNKWDIIPILSKGGEDRNVPPENSKNRRRKKKIGKVSTPNKNEVAITSSEIRKDKNVTVIDVGDIVPANYSGLDDPFRKVVKALTNDDYDNSSTSRPLLSPSSYKKSHPGGRDEIFFPSRVRLYVLEYEQYLAFRFSSKLKKERARKLKLCEGKNPMKFAKKLCSLVRKFYNWEEKSEPICANAKINGNESLEKVALCKLSWPSDTTFLTSPVNGQILYGGNDVRKAITRQHDLTIALFDGLGEFEYFLGRLNHHEHMKQNPDSNMIYEVTTVNILTLRDDGIHEGTKNDLTIVKSRVFSKYSVLIKQLAYLTDKDVKEVAKIFFEMCVAEYHTKFERNYEFVRLGETRQQLRKLFVEKLANEAAQTEDMDRVISEMFGDESGGPCW